MVVVFHQLVTVLLKPRTCFFFSWMTFFCFLSFVTGWCSSTSLSSFTISSRAWREELYGCVFGGVLLGYGFIHLLQENADLIHQLCTVLFDCLAPDKVNLLALDSILVPSIYSYKPFVDKDKNQLREYIIYLFFYTITETVDGNKIRMFITGKPDIMNVT